MGFPRQIYWSGLPFPPPGDDAKKIDAILNLLQPLGIKELARTGRVAIAREPMRPVVAQPKRVART